MNNLEKLKLQDKLIALQDRVLNQSATSEDLEQYVGYVTYLGMVAHEIERLDYDLMKKAVLNVLSNLESEAEVVH